MLFKRVSTSCKKGANWKGKNAKAISKRLLNFLRFLREKESVMMGIFRVTRISRSAAFFVLNALWLVGVRGLRRIAIGFDVV